MRWRDFFLQTSKDTPKDAANAAHRFLVRAGFLRQHAPGAFSHLPAAQRVIARLRRIIREELQAVGMMEWTPSAMTPAAPLDQSGVKLNGVEDIAHAGLVPTADCALLAVDFAHGQIKSYKQLPVGLFAFRQAPSDGVEVKRTLLRGRAALSCEMHVFHADQESLVAGRERLSSACGRILQRVGLACVAAADVSAESGAAGTAFVIPVSSGNERIARTPDGQYAATLDAASAAEPPTPPDGALAELAEVHTPDAGRVEDVCHMLGAAPRALIKTLIYTAETEGASPPRVVALVRGDHEVNERKLCRVVGRHLELADAATIEQITGAGVGFAGPVNLVERADRLIIDRDVAVMRDAATGANRTDYHITGVNPGRDFPLRHERVTIADIRDVVVGDSAPIGGGRIELASVARAGDVFRLGTGLCERLQAMYLDREGKARPLALLCGRLNMDQILALIVETHHDDDGILWPPAVAPFDALVLAIDPRDADVMRVGEQIHDDLVAAGVDVLLDDRDDRAGSKFKDADLIGIPLRIVVGKRALTAGNVELATRASRDKQPVPPPDAVAEIVRRVRGTGAA